MLSNCEKQKRYRQRLSEKYSKLPFYERLVVLLNSVNEINMEIATLLNYLDESEVSDEET